MCILSNRQYTNKLSIIHPTETNMSLNRKNTAGNQTTQTASQLPPQQHADSTEQKLGLSGFRTQFAGGPDRSLTGEQIKNYLDAFNKAKGDDPAYKLIPFDRKVQNTLISAVIVTKTTKLPSGRDIVAASALLLESSNNKLPSRQITLGVSTIEIPSTTTDAFNDTVKNKVIALVQSHFPSHEVKLAGGQVVTSEILPSDESRIQRAYAYAAEACIGVTDAAVSFSLRPRFSVAEIDSSERVYARIDQNNEGIESCGIPVRSDLSIAVYGLTHGSSDVFNNNQTPLVVVDTYTELLFTPPEAVPVGMVQPTQCLTPIVNITQMASEMGAETLELRLLSINAAAILAVNNAWATPLNPRLNRASAHLRDFGAIAYEMTSLVDGQTGVKIDTRSNAFTDEMFATILNRAVKNELYFRLFIEDNGQMSWCDSLFYLAAKQGPESRSAKATIINACNALTNKKFSDYWDGSKEIVFDEDTRIPLGFFKDGSSNKLRPLTDIGYLELLTQFGNEDLALVTEYDSYMNNKDYTIEQRYRKHLDMLDRVLDRQYSLKGCAYPVMINNEFLSALCKSLDDAKFSITPTNISFNMMPQQQRGQGRLNGRSGFTQGQTGSIFRQNQSTRQGGVLPNSLGRRYV